MKYRSSKAIVIVFAALSFIGCKKDQDVVTLGTRISSVHNSKIYVDGYTPKWNNNDPIYVNAAEYSVSDVNGSSAKIHNVVRSDAYRAIYPSSIVTNGTDMTNTSNVNVVLNSTQTFQYDESSGKQIVPIPMGAYTTGSNLTFHNLCSLVKVTVRNNSGQTMVLSNICLTSSNANLCGEGVAVVTGSGNDHIEISGTDESNKTVRLQFNGEDKATILNNKSRDYYIIVNPFNQSDIAITVNTVDGSCGPTITVHNASLANNSIVTVTDNVRSLKPIGGISGLYSVSDNLKVYFSQGNLQFNTTGTHTIAGGGTRSGTWQFAPHQYDMLSDGNLNASSTYTGWIDLFGWGTSGYHNSSDPYNIHYQPYDMTSDSYVNVLNWTGYGPSTNMSSPHLTGTSAKYDWGIYNGISCNGGEIAPGTWRTLTYDEWNYLLTGSNRNGAANKQGSGNIEGIPGLILLPDIWSLPSGCTFNPGYVSGTSTDAQKTWTRNTYTYEQWAKMEAAGAVFLPAEGYRRKAEDATTYSIGDRRQTGNYWSATNCDGHSDNGSWHASNFYFHGNKAGVATNTRRVGFSVRLTKDYVPQQ